MILLTMMGWGTIAGSRHKGKDNESKQSESMRGMIKEIVINSICVSAGFALIGLIVVLPHIVKAQE